jgi:hypothetical protein
MTDSVDSQTQQHAYAQVQDPAEQEPNRDRIFDHTPELQLPQAPKAREEKEVKCSGFAYQVGMRYPHHHKTKSELQNKNTKVNAAGQVRCTGSCSVTIRGSSTISGSASRGRVKEGVLRNQ